MNTADEFWAVLSDYASHFSLMLVVVTVLFVLNLAAVAIGEQSEEAFAISLLVFALLGLTGFGLVVVLWQCKRR